MRRAGRPAVRLQERVQALDLGDPRLRPPMGQLGQIHERRRAEVEEMLALQAATGALAPRPRPRAGRDARAGSIGRPARMGAGDRR
jgi:hypothetical protein